jgi:hypothetical protein
MQWPKDLCLMVDRWFRTLHEDNQAFAQIEQSKVTELRKIREILDTRLPR